MQRIGIVGGVGPLAAAHFYQRVIELSPAARDEDHVPVVLVSEAVPSRIAHLQGVGRSPVPALQRAVRTLDAAQVDAIAVPSATTHAYLSDMQEVTELPIFDLLGETANALEATGFGKALVLATQPTAQLGLYEQRLRTVEPSYPDAAGQATVDELIEQVKQGQPLEPLRQRLAGLVADWAQPESCIVLGCTELGVIAPTGEPSGTVIDASDVLARTVVRAAGADLAATRWAVRA